MIKTYYQTSLTPEWATVPRQVIPYFGSKWRMPSEVFQEFPLHTIYHQPFCGGASTLFKKALSEIEIVSDLNPGLINCLKVIKSHPHQLIKALNSTPRTKEEFTVCFQPHENSIEWARRYLCLAHGGYMGAGGRWSGGCSEDGLKRLQEVDWSFLWAASDRLSRVVISRLDAIESMQVWDASDTFHYVDPPYPKEARGSRDNRHQDGAPRRQYAFEMLDENSHRALAYCLHNLRGKVAISGRDCPLYNSLYKRWWRIEWKTQDSDRSAATEVVWFNY
ncbi:MAG: DNA adenine methylase [Leptolyngbya sp. SIO1D8]|nr:DNA adenine methylase [Leptolyngbya sp. SIO1D8]